MMRMLTNDDGDDGDDGDDDDVNDDGVARWPAHGGPGGIYALLGAGRTD